MWTLVTGGAKGLGASICLALAKQGYSVAIHYKTSKKEAEKIAASCRQHNVQAEIIQGSFSSQRETEKFLQEYTRRFAETQNVINNVGEYLIKSLNETSLDDMMGLYQVNLFAPYLVIKSLLPSLKKLQGSVVNIGVAGLNDLRADTYATAYTMTKSSLLMLTKAFAKELVPFSVKVNMISPGYLENSIDMPKKLSLLLMNRVGTLEEVSRIVTFLLDKNSEYITGQNIEIAGAARL